MQAGLKKVLVLDFGSQYTQLITRRIRELGVYAQIHPYHLPLSDIQAFNPSAIVLSGGPDSVHQKGAFLRDVKELAEIAPLLGICYGMQLMTHFMGGSVQSAGQGEYGRQKIVWSSAKDIHPCQLPADFPYFSKEHFVWMSHRDEVKDLPENFAVLAKSEQGAIVAISDGHSLGLQFHPEVTHTDCGKDFLEYFLFQMVGLSRQWVAESMLETATKYIYKHVSFDEKVLCALSGGVDSTVVATLLTQALGTGRVQCAFVNNGLLRDREDQDVIAIYHHLGLNFQVIGADDLFLSALKDVVCPEQKRKIIGKLFIDVFDELRQEDKALKWLAQGTLYPDIIESYSVSQLKGKHTLNIKSHHNVGGLPEKLPFKILEPLKQLFKDEVRSLGKSLGIPRDVLWRHPFPGPGLAVRILGAITQEKIDILKQADAIFLQMLKEEGLYDKIWQAFCVLLPVQTVGVQGDGRTYGYCLALRAVTSTDGMTADWFDFKTSVLKKISNKITNQVRQINRVVYDITSKPPGTIEWE